MDGLSQTPEQDKINALREILPEAFSEGKIDWEKLKATLGENVNFSNERYVLNWAGKSDAFKVLQTPTTKTLVPDKEKSINFDETENIFIEGENLEVLKVLQKSYFGKVKMIYIDPPYNTGNDSFIYPDKFSETKAEYEKRVGDKDEEGYMTKDGMFKKNSKENGQYHSNWLSMMMPRLYLAKNLLKQDGVIFLSIDDNEVHNLRLLLNEVFGEENFICQFIWKSKSGGANDSRFIAVDHEYILCYCKQSEYLNFNLDKNATVTTSYNLEDEKGKYALDRLDKQSIRYSKSLDYEIVDKDGCVYKPAHKNPAEPNASWRWGKETVKERFNELVFKEGFIYTKNYEKEGSIPRSLLIEERFGRSRTGKTEFTSLFDAAYFTAPKPPKLISFLADISTSNDDIVLDFFSGSGTTAQAIYELNKNDGGKRKFVCVQLPEICDEKSDAFRAGFKTISEISIERIKRASKRIAASILLDKEKKKGLLEFENTEVSDIDIGCKVLVLSNSNFKQWQQIEGKDAKALAEQMKLFVDPVSESATIENMVYELLLKSGKDINSKIEKKQNYFSINENELVLMLEKASQEIIDVVIGSKPNKVIALDKLFKGNDQLKTNTVLQMKDASIEFKTI
ncbi:MAG: site-specific DNA-methyltransferase [Saprospiraceae bacterium]|nr:site-specific DNA-methyltransferase [Saprospiraceae bacterium]